MELEERMKKIKLIVSDFDGVMTNNHVIVDENGVESVICNRADGLGIEMLKKKGVDIVVLSKEKNKVVEARCRKLGIKCYNGIDDKKTQFLSMIKEGGMEKEEVCFIGNDINDLECMKEAGIAIAPEDSHPLILKEADYITKTPGGQGVIREIAEIILNSSKKPKESLSHYS